MININCNLIDNYQYNSCNFSKTLKIDTGNNSKLLDFNRVLIFSTLLLDFWFEIKLKKVFFSIHNYDISV